MEDENRKLLASLRARLDALAPGSIKDKRRIRLVSELEEVERMLQETERTKMEIDARIEALLKAAKPR